MATGSRGFPPCEACCALPLFGILTIRPETRPRRIVGPGDTAIDQPFGSDPWGSQECDRHRAAQRRPGTGAPSRFSRQERPARTLPDRPVVRTPGGRRSDV